jgi:hypothetical protein
MMKVAFAGLLALAALGSPAVAGQTPQTMDPNKILFTVSTLSDGAVPVTPLKGKAGATDMTFHEDDWRQIEFFPASREQEIRQALMALAAFEREQRAPSGGWKKVYVRKLPAQPVVAGTAALATLAKALGVAAQPGPVINQGPGKILGRVAHGFSLRVGRGVALYGFSDASGVPVLGARVEEGAEDDALANAFVKLNAKHHLILVDWRAHLLLSGIAPAGNFITWRPDRN